MNKVCGHNHPHQIRPKTTVKRMMKTKKAISTIARSTKSCGQNTWPKMTNFRSITFIKRNGCPFIFTKGPANNNDNKTTVTNTRQL
jgi:hypothetical protein